MTGLILAVARAAGEVARDMLRKVLDAFARTDVDAAVEVVKVDKKVDRKYKGIIKQLIERMSDRCQNIAEYVIYMVLGTDVRHTSLDDVLAEIEAQST